MVLAPSICCAYYFVHTHTRQANLFRTFNSIHKHIALDARRGICSFAVAVACLSRLLSRTHIELFQSSRPVVRVCTRCVYRQYMCVYLIERAHKNGEETDVPGAGSALNFELNGRRIGERFALPSYVNMCAQVCCTVFVCAIKLIKYVFYIGIIQYFSII